MGLVSSGASAAEPIRCVPSWHVAVEVEDVGGGAVVVIGAVSLCCCCSFCVIEVAVVAAAPSWVPAAIPPTIKVCRVLRKAAAVCYLLLALSVFLGEIITPKHESDEVEDYFETTP